MPRSWRAPARRPTSSLLARTWRLPGLGAVRLAVPSAMHLASIDGEWPTWRGADDPSRSWAWSEIARMSEERFVLVSAGDEPMAIWAAEHTAPRKLLEGPAYRLDWVEVHPAHRSAGWGVATVLLVGCRAREVGADRLLIPAAAEAAPFYDALGAERRRPHGWKPPFGLVPYVLGPERLREMQERADGLEERRE